MDAATQDAMGAGAWPPHASGDALLPEVVLTPPNPQEQSLLEVDTSEAELPIARMSRRSESPQARRPGHRRGNSYGQVIQERSEPLPPSMPKATDLKEADRAIAKITRMERLHAQKHAWLKWSGVDAARVASARLNAPQGRDPSEDEEQRLVAKLEAAKLEPPEAASAPATSLQSATPPLSLSPTSSPTQSSSPVLSATLQARRGSGASTASIQEQLLQPKPSYVPRELLSGDWDDSSLDSASQDTWSEDSDSSNEDEPTGQIPSRLNLAHADVMTNKQMRRRLRNMRKLRYEVYDRNENGSHSHGLRDHVAQGLKYASRTQRTQRAMERYTPAVMGDTSEPDEKLVPPANVSEGSTQLAYTVSRHNSPGPTDSSGTEGERPHVWRRRQRKEWNNAPSTMDMHPNEAEPYAGVSVAEDPTPAQPLQLGPSQLPPKGYTTELVYDMLHENQRGAVLFGVAKRFSPQMLLLWDPSPWTDASGANTALDISTMQLPDPTWEWVQPTWLVDMTCDTDEDGWQYSGSFTGLQVWKRPIHFSHSRGPNTWLRKLYLYAQRRSMKNDERRKRHEATRPDEGVVAMMRSARARSLRWHGVPSMWTFVRRRRWVRLRRRLVPIPNVAPPPQEQITAQPDLVPLSESDSDDEVPRADRELRHMHHVYGALHTLHMLMPLFMVSSTQACELLRSREAVPMYKSEAWRRQFSMILDEETRVLNPFLAFTWVQRWLERDDLAFVTSSLRSQERRYQRRNRTKPRATMPHNFHADRACGAGLPPRINAAEALAARGPASLIREAVVERNATIAIDVMKMCAVDRLKLDLWHVWLGVVKPSELVAGGEREAGGPMAVIQHEWNRRAARIHACKPAQAVFSSLTERTLRSRIYDYTHTTAPLLDVWDILVAHLRDVVAMFDHERSRRVFIQLVERLQSTDFRASTPTHTNRKGSDSRWRVLRPGIVRLPTLPHTDGSYT